MRFNSNKGFTLVEAVIAMVLFALMASMLYTVNDTFVSNLNHGIQTAYAQDQAETVQAAMKSLAEESTNIWITPILKSGEQTWLVGSASGTNNIEVGKSRSNLSELTTTDLAEVDNYLYLARNALDFNTTTPVSFLYDPASIKRGYMIWFNCKNNDNTTSVKGVVEVKLMGPSSYSASARVDLVENAATVYPRASNTSNSIRVTLFMGQNLMSQLTNIQAALADLDALAPSSPYYVFKGSRVSRDYTPDPLTINMESSDQVTKGSGTAVFGMTALRPIAAYVVDYKNDPDASSFWEYAGNTLDVSHRHPSQFILYSSVTVQDNTFGAVTIKLPSPQDALAVNVPKTLGFVGALWASNTALAGAKDLGIDRSITFTLYPYLSE